MKFLAAKAGVVLSYLFVVFFRDKLHLSDGHTYTVGGMAILILGYLWHMGIVQARLDKIFGAAGATFTTTSSAGKVAPIALLCLALGAGSGCSFLQSLPPATIQADTAAGISVALSGYAIAQPDKAREIAADATTVKGIIDSTILPSFQAGATSGQLLNSSASQAMTLLNSKIVGLKNGPMIVAEIKLALGLFTSALSGTASPTAAMPANVQADLVAFFSGVSQGLQGFAASTPK